MEEQGQKYVPYVSSLSLVSHVRCILLEVKGMYEALPTLFASQ